jgi:hypothetical protein
LFYTVANSAATLANGQAVFANTASGPFTLTLPAAPSLGTYVNIIDANNFSANNLTLARNGSTIEGLAENLVINIGGAAVTLVYNGSTWEVSTQVGIQGGNVVTTTATQTLTNKTISFNDNTLTNVASINTTQTFANKTISGSTNTITVDGTDAVGFRTLPQNSQSANYTVVLTDSGKHILHPTADTTARTYTIPANSSVPYPLGTAITFINQSGAGIITIAITSDTMRLAGAGTTGSRTLAANGIATTIKIASTEWIISGTGLT